MLKYVNTGIVFQEVPDEVTLAVNISNCPCRCPGCHGSSLWDDTGLPLDTAAVDDLVKKYGREITCIAFMGGDSEPEAVNELARYMHATYPKYKVAWYSGRIRIRKTVCRTDFDYIKLGPYIRHLGPLSKPTTNQRLYRKSADGSFEDITHRFWKKM